MERDKRQAFQTAENYIKHHDIAHVSNVLRNASVSHKDQQRLVRLENFN